MGSWVNITTHLLFLPLSPPLPPSLSFITTQCVIHLLISPSIHLFMCLSPLFFLFLLSSIHLSINFPSIHLLIHHPLSMKYPSTHPSFSHPPSTNHPHIHPLSTYQSPAHLSIRSASIQPSTYLLSYLSINVPIFHQSTHLSSIHLPLIH